MQLGSYEIPEIRLVPNVINDLKLINEHYQRKEIKSKDLATLFGYSHPTATHFYRRLKALVAYGLIEGHGGSYSISDLGNSVLFPEDDEKIPKSKAVLNVELWKEIYTIHKKNLPQKFWVVLRDITGADANIATKYENNIKNWYLEDVANVVDDSIIHESQQSKGLSSSKTSNNQMSQQMALPEDSFGRVQLVKGGYIDVTDEATLEIAKSYIKVLEQKIKEKSKISDNNNKE